MPLLEIESLDEVPDRLGADRRPVIAIPIHDAFDDFVECLSSVHRHSPREIALLLVDDGSSDTRVQDFVLAFAENCDRRILYWRRKQALGYVLTANQIFAATAPRDIVLLNSDVIVGEDWFDRLHDAAQSDSRIATATPLTNNGTILSVPYRNRPSELPPDLTPEMAAARVASHSRKLRPRVPTAVGHCTYFKRTALDLVGLFDEAFTPGYGEEVDFSQRCVARGFTHVIADDVFVYHKGGASFGRSRMRLKTSHDKILAQRYPYYRNWIRRASSARRSALADAIASARRALLGWTVVVDATCLGAVFTGTQRTVIETIDGLIAHPAIRRVVVLMPAVDPPYMRELRARWREPASLTFWRVNKRYTKSAIDICYRPFQVVSRSDIATLRRFATRLVISQLDFIAYNNPTYFGGDSSWVDYRNLTRLALSLADGIVFLSNHPKMEAETEGLLGVGQLLAVNPIGTDHAVQLSKHSEHLEGHDRMQDELRARLHGLSFVLHLGTDYRHKNRLATLQMFRQMCLMGYDGLLVLAGAHVPYGSSRSAEAGFVALHEELNSRVVLLSAVTEETKDWLIANAALVVFTSLYEGFGLIPFEAARAGVPCLTSRHTSLADVLPGGIEVIDSWDSEVVARLGMALIADKERSQALVGSLLKRADELTWKRHTDGLVELFESVLSQPVRPIAAVTAEDGTDMLTVHRLPWATAYPKKTQAFLQFLSRRPVLGRILFAPMELPYHAAKRLRNAFARKKPKRKRRRH